MSTASATATDAEAEPAAKPAKKKLPLIIAIVVLLAAAGGGGYWFMGKKHAPKDEVREEVPPIYVPLENFTVNLQPEIGDQYLQVAISLKVAGEPVVEKLKVQMPEIRNRLLLLLSGKRASELTPSAGKEQLGKEIMDELNSVLDPALAKKLRAKAMSAAKPPDHAAEDVASEETAKTEPDTEQAAADVPDEEAEADPEAEAAADEEQAEPALSIVGVLFTSFIIQ